MTVQKALKELLIVSPFYGIFLLSLRKEIVNGNHSVKTAAVGPNGLNFTLYVNEDFWKKLSDKEQLAVLTHEVSHICFFHLTEHFKASNHTLMNIAMDASINQYIQNLPADCVTVESLSKQCGKNLELKRGAWYYYNELLDYSEKNPEFMNQFNNIDSHDMWPGDEMSEAERTLYDNQIKSRLKETAEQVVKQAGKIPGELSSILEAIKNKPPVFNWKRYFRRLIGNSITSEIQLTRMRPSKRFPDARGIRMKRKPNIMVAVDTSGSIMSDDLKDFFSEIHHIWKTGVNVTVVEFDTKIQNIFEYKGQQNIEVHGRGGTDATSAIEYYKQHHDFSSCIIFTDGYLSTFKLPICQSLIWVITKGGNKVKYPGQVIFIP
jgi:predicted metal-dependent peptidase